MAANELQMSLVFQDLQLQQRSILAKSVDSGSSSAFSDFSGHINILFELGRLPAHRATIQVLRASRTGAHVAARAEEDAPRCGQTYSEKDQFTNLGVPNKVLHKDKENRVATMT